MLNLQTLIEMGIHPTEGLACCADDPDFYEEMLSEFVSEGRAGVSELRRSYENRDWSRYTIRAHTVKSTAKTIGAIALSEQARDQEAAGKALDEQKLLAGHDGFLNAYESLLGQLDRALSSH